MSEPSAASAPAPGLVWPALAAGVAASLWLALALTLGDQVLGAGGVRQGLRAAAAVATATAAVLALERLILMLLHRPADGARPTGLQRMAILGVLTFAASFVTLTWLGVALGTVLEASAFMAAVIGFALRTPITGLVSGLYIHVDNVLRVGDQIERDGGPVTVTAMNWRSTVGVRADGARVVIDNARLAEGQIVIRPQGLAPRLDLTATAPLAASPAQVAALAGQVLADVEAVDHVRPWSVTLAEVRAQAGLADYRIGAWLRPGEAADRAAGEVLSRLWYAFQRSQIRLPGTEARTPAAILSALRPGLAREILGEDGQLPEGCELLLYAPGERLVAPERADGWRFWLLAGRAAPAADSGLAAAARADLTDPLARRAAAAALAEELVALVGPYGWHAVEAAARETPDPDDLRRRVADEIPDEAARAGFLARGGAGAGAREALGEGARLEAVRDPFGVLTCGERLGALGEVVLLAAPPRAWSRLPARLRAAA